MKNNFRWHKEQINGKWYSVCDHEHVPMIEHTKDDKYKVRNCNGKAILHESFADAEKLAIETYKKFEKFNKSFEGQEQNLLCLLSENKYFILWFSNTPGIWEKSSCTKND